MEIKTCSCWSCSELFDAEDERSGECYHLGYDECFECESFMKCNSCKNQEGCSKCNLD